jgi:cell fate regulator YaaT (PSP1 superfamily)
VKDLAGIFRTRIELHQIGVRDEAKMLGGIGCCGRPLCCATFLGDFEPVSIKMAKNQNLSLNPYQDFRYLRPLDVLLKVRRLSVQQGQP